jgi:hypothetical protein
VCSSDLQNRTLVQLNYFVWFSAHPAQNKQDPEAGTLDGTIWRVTLDDDGAPLAYESVSASGAHHRWFPAQPLKIKPSLAKSVVVAEQLAPGTPSVRITSAAHDVAELLPQSEDQKGIWEYELRHYDELSTLSNGQGTRSLFGPDGVVTGTEREHAGKIWPKDFPKPGALRQWGHHIVSFHNGWFFDDPHLLEQTFDVPKLTAGRAPLQLGLAAR